MTSRLKVILRYTIILGLTAFLVWFSLRGLSDADPSGNRSSWDYLQDAWAQADKGWLLAMAAIAVLSHVIRAERWRMLMKPSGYAPRLSWSFYSLMVGYLVNLVIPRGGELSRCYNLYKIDKTPVEISFGTVVTERLIDMLFLLLLIGLSFAIESSKLLAFIDTLPIGSGNSNKFQMLGAIALGLILLLVIAWLILRKRKSFQAFFRKTLSGFSEGLLSVFRLKERKLAFFLYSVAIWALYYVMSYTVIMAFPSTSVLGMEAVLSLFAIGAIAMAVPLPGGTGSYHVLVPQGLVFLYNLPLADAVAFTFIFHGWQTLIMIIGGAISLLLSSIIIKKRNAAKA